MNKVLFIDEKGNTCILTPAENCGLSFEEIVMKDVPQSPLVKVISSEEVPSDRRLRNAWKTDFTLDETKAQNLIRESRDSRLVLLDKDAVAAERAGNIELLNEINAKAQRLRDIPQQDVRFIGDDNDLKNLFQDIKEDKI